MTNIFAHGYLAAITAYNKRINAWTNKVWLSSCLTNYSQTLLARYAGVIHAREMINLEAIKRSLIQLSEKLVLLFVVVWCVVCSALGIIFVSKVLGIVFPIMSLVMYLFGTWGIFGLLVVFRKVNPKLKQSELDLSVLLFAGFGLVAMVFMLVSGFRELGSENAYFAFTSAVFPLGVTVGVSKFLKFQDHTDGPHV